MTTNLTKYDILELFEFSDVKDVQKSFEDLSLRLKSEIAGCRTKTSTSKLVEKLRLIEDAFATLGDKKKKKQYDAELRRMQQQYAQSRSSSAASSSRPSNSKKRKAGQLQSSRVRCAYNEESEEHDEHDEHDEHCEVQSDESEATVAQISKSQSRPPLRQLPIQSVGYTIYHGRNFLQPSMGAMSAAEMVRTGKAMLLGSLTFENSTAVIEKGKGFLSHLVSKFEDISFQILDDALGSDKLCGAAVLVGNNDKPLKSMQLKVLSTLVEKRLTSCDALNHQIFTYQSSCKNVAVFVFDEVVKEVAAPVPSAGVRSVPEPPVPAAARAAAAPRSSAAVTVHLIFDGVLYNREFYVDPKPSSAASRLSTYHDTPLVFPGAAKFAEIVEGIVRLANQLQKTFDPARHRIVRATGDEQSIHVNGKNKASVRMRKCGATPSDDETFQAGQIIHFAVVDTTLSDSAIAVVSAGSFNGGSRMATAVAAKDRVNCISALKLSASLDFARMSVPEYCSNLQFFDAKADQKASALEILMNNLVRNDRCSGTDVAR